MQLKFKKICLLSTIIVYCASFLMQSNLALFEVWAKELNIPRVNIVAILVDNKIYGSISEGLERYATDYVQQQLIDTKALVIPLDLTDMHAYDIHRMLENAYFDGLKDVNSSLVGLIMFGDIPLPVVNQDGYIFPTVYPYVDFEDQKYVWDPVTKYFVPTDNPMGQAEIWHGLINYGTDTQAYLDFFEKIWKYVSSPDDFIGDSMWYEDFISQRKGLVDENFRYYRNRVMFGEDLGYQRYSPLMKKMFRGELNKSAVDLITELEEATDTYYEGREELEATTSDGVESRHTTKMVQQEIDTSFISDYNDIFSEESKSTMRENVFAGGRWTKTYESPKGDVSLDTDADSTAAKMQLKDELYLGNENFLGFFENLNELMETMIDKKIEEEHLAMDIVVPVEYKKVTGKRVDLRCYSFVSRFENYYFGDMARYIDNAENLSIYRGTYRNLTGIDDVTYGTLLEGKNPIKSEYEDTDLTLKSIGGSYDIFSSQAEGNRGYTMVKVEDDLDVYDDKKTTKKAFDFRFLSDHVARRMWLEFCDDDDEDYQCEELGDFVNRWWGGASTLNLDPDSIEEGKYKFKYYLATDSWRPIFAIDGSQSLLQGEDEGSEGEGWKVGSLIGPQWDATSFKAYKKYSSPTEREGWRLGRIGFRNIFFGTVGFIIYADHTPDVHMPFSDVNYRWLKPGIVMGWDAYIDRESSKMFTLSRHRKGRILSCGGNESYTYKVISSVVEHKSTTEDQINGVDRDKYGESGTLGRYYHDIKVSFEDLQEDMMDIVDGLSGLVQTINSGNEYIYIKMKDLEGEAENLSPINQQISGASAELSGLQKKLEEAKNTDAGKLQQAISDIEGKIEGIDKVLSDMDDELLKYQEKMTGFEDQLLELQKQLKETTSLTGRKEIQKAIKEVNTSIGETQDSIDKLNGDIEDKNKEKGKLQDELGELQEKLKDMELVDIESIEKEIAEAEAKLGDLNKEKEKAKGEIEKLLKDISDYIKIENSQLADIYKLMLGLYVENIVNAMEFIIYLEGGNPDHYYGGSDPGVQIGFLASWLSAIATIEDDIMSWVDYIIEKYEYIYDLIEKQQKAWKILADKLKAQCPEYSEDIDKVSEEMEKIFEISEDGDVEDEPDLYVNGHGEPEGNSGIGDEKIILKKNTAREVMKQFEKEMEKVDTIYENLVILDELGPKVLSEAKKDVDFIRWMLKHSVNYKEFSDSDWISNYAQWAKGPGYDSAGAVKNHDLLQGVSEHFSGLNIITSDRPIDSPRYVVMQSVAGNEMKFIYPDLFKVEVYDNVGKSSQGYDKHELLFPEQIKENLVKYLEGKVNEYNTIIDNECANALPMDIYFSRLRSLGFVLATPDKALHSCGSPFSYDEFVETLGGEKMLDIIAEMLFYQSLTNLKKKSSSNVAEDLKLIRKSFDLNNRREWLLNDYLIEGVDLIKHTLFLIPTYEHYGYEVAFINSDGRDLLIVNDDTPEEILKVDNTETSTKTSQLNLNRRQPSQQENDLEDVCKIPKNGRLPLFKLSGGGVTSPWLIGFKCWWKETLKNPIKIKLTFDESLGDIVVSEGFVAFIESLGKSFFSETKDAFVDRGDAMVQYADAWNSLLSKKDAKDADKAITQMQVEADKHNQETMGGDSGLSNALSDVYRNVKIRNDNALLSDSNPSSVLKIESAVDVGNITVEFFGTGDDGCLKVGSNTLCKGSSFTKTFNPKTDPFEVDVESADHIAGKFALDMKINVGGGYIENIIKYTVSPSMLDRAEISIDDKKTIAGMISPVIITGYDQYGNVVSRGLEKYDFTVSQGKFLKDGAYQDKFTTNDFRDLKFYYHAPLDAADGSVAVIQISRNKDDGSSDKILGTYQQTIVQGDPEIKWNGNTILQGRNNLVTDVKYRLSDDESIYNGTKLDVSKLQRLDIYMKDSNGSIIDIDSQILVTSQNGLVVLGQVQKSDKGEDVFFETSKGYMTGGILTLYFYPTTVAGDDIINVDIPGLDTRVINFSIKPASLENVQIIPEKQLLYLGETMDVELFLSDVYGNLVDQHYDVELTFDDVRIYFEENPDAEGVITLSVDNGYLKTGVHGIGAGLAFIEGQNCYVEFYVDKHLLPQEGLNIMYLNYFGNDRGNQWGYFSDNNKNVEYMMTNSNKIITTTTQLVSEDKIKRLLWKIEPGFKIVRIDDIDTTMTLKGGNLDILVGGISEMISPHPEFTWMQVTRATMANLLNNESTASKNYAFFLPKDSRYSINGGVLYDDKEPLANILDGEITLELSTDILENNDNVRRVFYRGKDCGFLIFHYPKFYPNADDFSIPGERYVIDKVFVNGSSDMMTSVGVYDSFSEFELDTNYKSIQNSDEIDEQIGFLGDFKNITLFSEGQIVGEATKKFGSEFVINLGDPVLSRKSLNDKVYGTLYDGGIGQEFYTDSEKEIFGTYQIDFNRDGMKDWLVVYADGTLELAKNYGGNPDLRNMQELMRVAVDVQEVYVGDADGNGYEDILLRTSNNQIRAYLNNGGIFDVDGSLVCLNQNVFGGEISETPSDMGGVRQLFVEDMDTDGIVDIVTYDEKGYIKVFYGGSTKGGPNYLSTKNYTCDPGWYSRQEDNTTVVVALGLHITNEDIYDNSMLRWVGLERPEIEIEEDDLEDFGIHFDPNSLEDLISERKRRVDSSIEDVTEEIMDKDKFDVDEASAAFIAIEDKFVDITVYQSRLVGGDSNNYIFSPSSYLDPTEPDDIGSTWKNYYVKNGSGILVDGDIVTVRVTVKASDEEPFVGTYGDVIEGPWNVYYDKDGIIEGVRFIQNQRNAVLKPRDGGFSYIVDNISLSPGEKLIFEYDLEYHAIPLKKMSITYATYWSDDTLPDIKLQDVEGCDKDFYGYVNGGRSFEQVYIPLQDMIDEEYADEDEMTEDYARDVIDAGSDVNQMPGIVPDIIDRIRLLGGQGSAEVDGDALGNMIKDGIDDMGVSLNIDLGMFIEQVDAIEDIVDDMLKGMCNGFSFGGSSNCKGLPVPFNQAFLAPGKYHLFGCWELPMGKLEHGIPMFFFPGTLKVGPYDIPFPNAQKKGEVDNFVWIGGGSYPSFLRIYAAPTLTAQLGIAVCMGINKVGEEIPSPFADIGGNCLVFAVKPQCKSDDEDSGLKKDDENPNEVYEVFVEDVRDSGICLESQKGPQVTSKGYRPSPFNLHGYTSKYYGTTSSTRKDPILSARDWFKKNVDVRGGRTPVSFDSYDMGLIKLEINPYDGEDESANEKKNSVYVGEEEVSGTDSRKNKIKAGIQQGLRKILIDKWLDPQIRYIANHLTKMHVNILLPDFSKLIDSEIDTLKNVKNELRSGNIWSGAYSGLVDVWSGVSNSKWYDISKNRMKDFNKAISNPFEALASLMNESNIINISFEHINVKIPMVFQEDINFYRLYLLQRLEVNQDIMNKWKSLYDSLTTDCSKIEDKEKREECNKEVQENLNSFITFEGGEWKRMQRQIYSNLITLEKYRNFPFEIYEWIHVIDRYMSEIASLINNTIGYLAYWTSTNAKRFVGYVDAIVLIINIIRTYQLLIDFSKEWGQNCGTCTKDTYDQYSCKLSFLCDSIQLPIFQIPNFKLPNITIDLTKMDLGLDLILPIFNFQPVRINLPEIPNLPEPISANIKLFDLPKIPILPEPPQLPELPSFIPEVELELPILPPAPEVPKLPSQIEAIIKVAKLIGKIYCIVKGKFGLVGESSVKARIEQMTQRTYEVEWIDKLMEYTNWSAAPIHYYGLDYEIISYVDLQFDFDVFYSYLDTLTKSINNMTTSSLNRLNNQANTLLNDNDIVKFKDSIDGASFDIKLGMRTPSNLDSIGDVDGLMSDEIEYTDYETGKKRLQDVLAYFKQETRATTQANAVNSSIDKIEKQISKTNTVVPNLKGLEMVKDDVDNYLNEKRDEYLELENLIKNDYDGFLAMVDANSKNGMESDYDTGKMLTFNVQLFDVDASTSDTIKSVSKQNPYEMILENKKTIVDGYWNAINSNSATDLGMSQAQYLALRDHIGSMKNQVTTWYSVVKPVSSTKLMAKNSIGKSINKTLLSDADGARLGSNMEVAHVVDPSVFSEGIYETIVEGPDEGKLSKVVFADSFASHIGNRYFPTDHFGSHDIILWDGNSIYRKCVNGYCPNDGGGYGTYYVSEVVSEIPYVETWLKFDGETILKIADENQEVRDWRVAGQNYDILTFTWKLEDVDAYLIKLVERIDHSYEKADFTSIEAPVHYVLALPDGTDLDQLYDDKIKLELLKKVDTIENLSGKDLFQVVYYDGNRDLANIILSNIDRKWYYLRIATLDLYDDVYRITSPRSNQITAGRQIVGDNLPPAGDPVLHRPSVPEITSEGNDLKGYVGTRYKLVIDWEDNVALYYISLSKDGEILDEKYTAESSDSVSTNIDIHTKEETETYTALGIDQFGNKTEKVIKVTYEIPDISITDVSKNSDGESVSVVAELSQDIDQGTVSFQRRRGNAWKSMKLGGLDVSDVSIGVGDKIVAGGPFSVGNALAMYGEGGGVIASVDPDTAEIKIQPEFQNTYGIVAKVDDSLLFQIYDENREKSVFSITIPTTECIKIEAENYNILDLPENGEMGIYNGGKVVSIDGNNILFASKTCQLYSEIGLEGTYSYDRELGAVKLTLYQISDLNKSKPIKIWLKADPLVVY